MYSKLTVWISFQFCINSLTIKRASVHISFNFLLIDI